MEEFPLLPVIKIDSDNLPDGWERAVTATYDWGIEVKTEYDQEGQPPSKDAFVIINVANPMNEPRIHRFLPGGLAELEAYRREVVEGIRDQWIGVDDKSWQYTYHDRLFGYQVTDHGKVNQMELILHKLANAPHSRRAIAITWQVGRDHLLSDPPCLQNLWFRVYGDKLVMTAQMRSNDALKAAFMNMYAFTDLQRWMARQLSERLGKAIAVGQYIHIAYSFHIYGKDEKEYRAFHNLVAKRSFEDRTYRTDDPEIIEILTEASRLVDASIDKERQSGRKGL